MEVVKKENSYYIDCHVSKQERVTNKRLVWELEKEKKVDDSLASRNKEA